MFEIGLQYVRADFHLHTCKDKEFVYSGEPNSFVNDYVSALKSAEINVGVITNHNKFDKDEYKAIRKAAKRQDIFILPGVELTIKEGANGIHTLIVFNPDEWLEDGNNHIQTFLTAAFATIPNPENRNTKSVYDLKNVFEQLDAYGRDYFIIFAHVDQIVVYLANARADCLNLWQDLLLLKIVFLVCKNQEHVIISINLRDAAVICLLLLRGQIPNLSRI